ncbi:FIG014328: hypothetical protein [hydrothermal vent metagenome]|uniref:DUF2333 domain-containing protein n=1 Tax=hydrothermal vent metagenome TaxID=652676 RepID=A0A3B0Z120_9ZZZZ
MKFTDRAQTLLWKTLEWFKGLVWKIGDLYRPANLKQKGMFAALGLVLGAALVLSALLGIYWSQQPGSFDVHAIALQRVSGDKAQVRVGVVYTSTLIKIGEVLLDKPGGYLSNDIMPPGVWLDNMPNWEFGALVMLRDGTAALRNHMSRSQSQSVESPSLAEAEPRFNFSNDSWLFPPTEGEYRKGLEFLEVYMRQLADASNQQAQFYARADNLRQYLEIVEKRLGSLSQRLSASVGQIRINTDLAGDAGAIQSTAASSSVVVKTPWLELDDVFYEARGATWALSVILKAVEHDFEDVLKKKNALISLRQIIRELEEAQQPTLSPVIINGSGFGLFANYSLTMANYIARANAAVIDIRDLLQQG